MKKAFCVIFCVFCLASPGLAQKEHGSVFIRTLRGNATAVKTDSRMLNLEQNQTVLAKEVQIRCEDGDFASFVLSNRSAGILKGSGAILISKFLCVNPSISGLNIEEEPSPSIIEIYLERGDLTISRSLPRPSSKFLVSTPFGKFECIGREIKIVVDENSATAYAVDNPFNFISDVSQNPEYVGIGYAIKVAKNGDRIEFKRSPMELPKSKDMQPDFESAENAWKTTMFLEDEETKDLCGKRTISKSFWLKRGMPPRRI